MSHCPDQGEYPQLDDEQLAAQLALEEGILTGNESETLNTNANLPHKKLTRAKGDVWWSALEHPLEKLPKNYSPGKRLIAWSRLKRSC